MYTYIVVDDEELIRKGTIKKISPMKSEVTCIGEASNGQEAIDMIEKLHPDIVIMDMNMPVVDGMELLPILADKYPEMPIIVISGYKDFDYIKQAISSNAVEYLLKPFSKESVQSCLKKAIEMIGERKAIHSQIADSENEKEQAYFEYDVQLLNNLIMGNEPDNIVLTSQKLKFINETHSLVLITMYFEKLIDRKSIESHLSSSEFGDLALFIGSIYDEHLGFVILFLPNNSPVSEEILIEQVLESLLSTVSDSGPCLVGISSKHNSLKSLHSAYQETTSALDSLQIHSKNYTRNKYEYIFYKKDIDPLPLIWDNQQEFMFRIEAGMADETDILVDDLFAFYDSLPEVRFIDIKYHCYQLVGQCSAILSEYLQNTTAPTHSESIMANTNRIFSTTELHTYYKQFFLNICQTIKPMSIYSSNDTIEKICTYLSRNYANPLNQEFIASLFYINRSYMSTLFKERTGETFIDYLNNIRIEKAKELLESTNKKMYNIARSVGYDNAKYFFRIFKKKTGITPEQYRKKK